VRIAQWVIRSVTFVLGLGLGAMAFAQEAAKAPEPTTLAALDAALAKALADAKIPGMGVAIIENGAVVFSKGYGFADVAQKTPVDEGTRFRAGSISKVFIGLSAMALVEEGNLSLDATLASLAPEVSVVNPFAKDAPLRLAHLLEHTSGWPDYTLKQFSTHGRGMSLGDAVLKDSPYTSRTAPGQYYAYCNPGSAAAALMVERAAGVAFERLVQDRFWTPMGMTSATFDKPLGKFANSYLGDGTTPAGFMELAARPVGAMSVTPRDLARYPLLMLGRGTLDGRAYLTPESVARIERSETTTAARLGLTTGYGLANLASHHPKAVFRGHGGAVDGALALAEYRPGHGSGFVLMWTQQKEFPAAEIIRNYLTRDTPKPAAPTPVPLEGGLDRLTGSYEAFAVRQPFGEPFEALLNLTDVSREREGLIIDGKKFTHVGGLLFQREDRSAPTVAFDLSRGEPRMLGSANLRRLTPSEWGQRIGWLIAFAALSVFALIHTFVWLYGLARRRLHVQGGIGLRLLPLMSVLSLWTLAALVQSISAMDTPVLLPLIGTQSYWSLSLFATTAAIPVLGFLSFWRGLTAGYGAATWIRLYAMGAGALTLIAAVYLNDYGWIGMMSWAR
jgi:CubicO group peptidase (beta-lactamase class C family)